MNLIKTVIAAGTLALVHTAVTPPAYACGSNPKAIAAMKSEIERLNREAGFEKYKFTAFRGCAGGVIALNPAFVQPTPAGATAGHAPQVPGEASR
ncbi:MAG: hypothetical protein WDN31_13895 [Hyphomicrobium sp.]